MMEMIVIDTHSMQTKIIQHPWKWMKVVGIVGELSDVGVEIKALVEEKDKGMGK